MTRSVWLDGTAEPGSSLAAVFLGGMHWSAQWVGTCKEVFDAKAVLLVAQSARAVTTVDMIR